jgi:hypothetical protein
MNHCWVGSSQLPTHFFNGFQAKYIVTHRIYLILLSYLTISNDEMSIQASSIGLFRSAPRHEHAIPVPQRA